MRALQSGIVFILLLLGGGAFTFALGSAASYDEKIVPLLEAYCFDCHSDGVEKGEFSMDSFTTKKRHLEDREHWMSVWNNLRSQIMPPSSKPQPSPIERAQLLAWIEQTVFKLDPANPDPGKVTIRRLNREEYRNSVYDLLGVEYDVAEAFPADDSGYGFDNIGDVLSMSPLLMEKYLLAAEDVVETALPKGDTAQVPVREIPGRAFGEGGRWLPFAQGGQLSALHEFEWDGEYLVHFDYSVHGASQATTHEASLDVTVGDKKVGGVQLAWDQRSSIRLSGKVKVKKGQRTITARLDEKGQPANGEEELALRVQRVVVVGPLGGKVTEFSKGHRMIFVDGPPSESAEERRAYARKIMRSFVSRAYRRPLDAGSINRLVSIVEATDKRPGKDFEDGIKRAISTVLASPRFLFRAEIQPEPNNPGKVVPLEEYDLAGRLSFFLWSSVPDDRLLSLAYKNELRTNLRSEVERMLKDPRAERLTRNFVGQWLQTRDLESVQLDAATILGVESAQEAAKVFDPRLRTDMKEETERLFQHLLDEGKPAEELISAPYSFLNERLAKYYGVPGVKGEEYRKVDLSKFPLRGGILTHGSFLILTSNPTRTSPVKRGLFVLDNLLGTPAPPAPEDVPELEEAAKESNEPLSMREQMVAHRVRPDCKGCHARMDPIGLGLEHFNALGQFRIRDAGKVISAEGELITGETFSNAPALRKVLADSRRPDFYRCLSEKMLTYAIGRGTEYYDAPTINLLVQHMETQNGNLRELVHGIVQSAPFQKRRGEE